MEKLILVKPDLSYKEAALEYINEFYQYNSMINGVGGLDRYLDDYEGWLKKLEQDEIQVPNESRVPALTHFLVRVSDNKIVGMNNIRLAENQIVKEKSGHIGYSIRPTERQKGYNKINLYLSLEVCQKHNLKEVILYCFKNNLGSKKTILALDGKLFKEFILDGEEEEGYIIDVDSSLEKNKNLILE